MVFFPFLLFPIWRSVRCPAPNSGKSVQDPGCCTEGILNMSQHHSYSNMPFISSSDWFEAQQVWGNTAAVSPHVVYGETRPNRNSYAVHPQRVHKRSRKRTRRKKGTTRWKGPWQSTASARAAYRELSAHFCSFSHLFSMTTDNIQSMNSKCEQTDKADGHLNKQPECF